MKASETNLFNFLEGNRQFIIPIYQRTYSWNREQCDQLWNDIIQAATRPEIKAHFVGSIVYIQHGLYQVASIPQLLVIDGQQRLTTLTLLLTALAQAAKAENAPTSINSDQIYDYFLVNRYGKGEDHYKLLLTQSDRATLIGLIEHGEDFITGDMVPAAPLERLCDNYRYFAERIHTTNLDLQSIYQGISKLVLVDIALDRDHDDPQLIFESLNSTGMDLSQADLIRNHILMRLEPEHQQRLYEQHWYPMERLFGQLHYATHFDRFMRDYLTIKTRTIPRIDAIYKAFKAYCEKLVGTSIDNIIADVHRFARLYVRLTLHEEKDFDLLRAFEDINEAEVNVAYPFLLEAYGDYEQGQLGKADFLAFVRLVESYVFRRAICEIPTHGMNKTFATLMRGVDKSNYRQSVEETFMKFTSSKRFPRDDDFRPRFAIKDVYQFQRRNYVLRKLENHDRKERVDVMACTIEHILPQNPKLPQEWQRELGPAWQDVQKRFQHTIGNLTLTAYNSEMSDKPFREKRDMDKGFRRSPLYLNEGLGQIDHWNAEAIQERATRLAERAIAIWSMPKGSGSGNGDDTVDELYPLEHYATLSPNLALQDLFRTMRQRILNLDAEVLETRLKHRILFGIPDKFAILRPLQTQVTVNFFINLDNMNDPLEATRLGSFDAQTRNTWRYFSLQKSEQLDYAFNLVKQAFLFQRDSEEESSEPFVATLGSDIDSADIGDE